MTYFVDIFSIDTFEAFAKTDKTITGFHIDRKAWVAKIAPGDMIICYVKGVSCWFGLLEVTGPMQEVAAGSEVIENYTLQLPTQAKVWLDKGKLLPIKRPDVWNKLSFTQNIAPGAGGWNWILRSSAVRLNPADGAALAALMAEQAKAPIPDGITDEQWEKKRGYKMVNAEGKTVSIQVPEPEVSTEHAATAPAEVQAFSAAPVRTSHKMQALLADIGLAMGFEVWIPKADKEAVASEMVEPKLLTHLPSSQFSEPAAKTVEQIDVLWLQKKSIVRAFEVEHTTAVYSGLLRMADLLALQPNFLIKLHIVAPDERRKKVFQELQRPAFAIFNQGSLATLCTYLPYEKIEQLALDPNLEYLKHDILDKLEEAAEPDFDSLS